MGKKLFIVRCIYCFASTFMPDYALKDKTLTCQCGISQIKYINDKVYEYSFKGFNVEEYDLADIDYSCNGLTNEEKDSVIYSLFFTTDISPDSLNIVRIYK